MQIPNWRKVIVRNAFNKHPIPRWGHSCTVIGRQMIIFGGYADSNYMNDLWSYNTDTMEWKEIETTQQIPSKRSNSSMHYDEKNKRIVLFGGGGPDKQRFNEIKILDWVTKKWSTLIPKQNQQAPWQRTYHTSQLYYPFLIVYGGQGISDMNDLWVFNFITLNWQELNIHHSMEVPCARRFHSSVLIEHKFYVIGGCYGKYLPLSDIYCIDLHDFFQTGFCQNLKWERLILQNQGQLSRWGQSSSFLNGKIYIFGGRNKEDLNDILVIDLKTSYLTRLTVNSEEKPKVRRRHSNCYIGSCLLVFGGFNGQYLNDVHYINMSGIDIEKQQKNIRCLSLLKYVNQKHLSDGRVMTIEEEQVFVHKGLIVEHFENKQKMQQFLLDLNKNYSKNTILQIMKQLYDGSLRIPYDLAKKYSLISKPNKSMNIQDDDYQSIPEKSFVQLEITNFTEFIQEMSAPADYYDTIFKINSNQSIYINSIKLKIINPYFQFLLSGNYLDTNNEHKKVIINIQIPPQEQTSFKIMLYYLSTGILVVPLDMELNKWASLIKIANYYCIQSLVKICQQCLIEKITVRNSLSMFDLALQCDLQYLLERCSHYYIKLQVRQQQFFEGLSLKKLKQITQSSVGKRMIEKVYQQVRFDILQKILCKTHSNQNIKQNIELYEKDKQNKQINCKV